MGMSVLCCLGRHASGEIDNILCKTARIALFIVYQEVICNTYAAAIRVLISSTMQLAMQVISKVYDI